MKDLIRNRRRNYFIDRRFQADFILKFCALVLIGSLISGVIIYRMAGSTVTTTFENSRLTIKSTADFILPSVLVSGLVVIVVTGLATIAVTLFTSHRIAGPLYRMEKDVRDITGGDLTVKFHLRQRDEIKPLATGLDEMVMTLKTRVSDIKKAAEELESALEPSKAGLQEKAKDRLRLLKAEIGKFRIS
jgi:methyl-accepting chemotaxis protein